MQVPSTPSTVHDGAGEPLLLPELLLPELELELLLPPELELLLPEPELELLLPELELELLLPLELSGVQHSMSAAPAQ